MGRRIKDLKGQRFSRLLVVEFDEVRKGSAYWLCWCDCDRIVSVGGINLTSGRSKSCGCLRKIVKTTHGEYGSPEYRSWEKLWPRTTNPNANNYQNYGGRGIKVCKRWEKFENFLKDMGKKPSAKHTLDRIDNNKDYTPDNCRWATRKEQARNRRNNHVLKFNGKSQTVTEWAEEIGIPCGTLYSRINQYNWSIEKAFTTPVQVQKKEGKK